MTDSQGSPVCLDTTGAVIDALGGNRRVAEMLGLREQAVSNWRSWKAFPSRHYVVMRDELMKLGYVAPDSLWNMTEPSSPSVTDERHPVEAH